MHQPKRPPPPAVGTPGATPRYASIVAANRRYPLLRFDRCCKQEVPRWGQAAVRWRCPWHLRPGQAWLVLTPSFCKYRHGC